MADHCTGVNICFILNNRASNERDMGVNTIPIAYTAVVTDHRIGFTIQKLDRVIEGELDEVIEALIHYDQSMKLAGE